MADSNTTEIQKLYVAYFTRPADPTGLQFWTGQMQTNANFYQTISHAFSTSDEYQQTYGGLDNTALVQAVYEHMFGRAGEATGVQFWVDRLNAHDITIDNVVTAVAAGAQGSDLFAYNAKVAAATVFTQHLDTSVELQAYSTQAGGQVAKDYITAVVDLQSAATANDPGYIDATISHMVDVSGVSAQLVGVHPVV